MLRKTTFVSCWLVLSTLLLIASGYRGADSTATIRRLTLTSETVLNLNPSLSGDGRIVAFESSEDLADAGGQGFHALRAPLEVDSTPFTQMALSRAIAPALSQDGSSVAFASKDDPLDANHDGNSEIFLYHQSTLTQITNTIADNETGRTADGSSQPSISDDGRFLAFSSNRDLTGRNGDTNFEIFIFDTSSLTLLQVTDASGNVGATSPKISGDGNVIAFLRETGTSRELVLQSRIDPASSRVIAQNMALVTLAYGRAISDDGLRVVYSAEPAPNSSQVFLWDGRNNLTRQLTFLEARDEDVSLQATISGDGSRVAFATRRNVIGGNPDHSVELYLLDVPSGQIESVSSAPASATAEIISSLNDDGSRVVFSFPRVLSGGVSSSGFANNSEIYVGTLSPRPAFGSLSILNGAAPGAGQAI